MLTKLVLTNYRGFEQHSLPLRSFTVLVGKNNAGKSTVVEALRLISLVVRRYRSLSYSRPPRWLPDMPMRVKGVSPAIDFADFDYESIFHQYGDPPCSICAEFESGAKIEAFVGPSGQLFATINGARGEQISSKGVALQTALSPLFVLPQIGPLSKDERVLVESYVKSSAGSALASLHFRNELRQFYDRYASFKRLAEEHWPGLQIKGLEGRDEMGPDVRLYLLVRDGEFVAEVAKMGHGLQMWLQTMWFLTRAPRTASIVLDEPDVFMHADLQRRLIRLLRGRHRQTLVATHSVEILSEVEPDEVLVVDRTRKHSRFADSVPAVQRVVESVGGVHNLHLARLWSAKRFLLVEGDDMKLLRIFHRKACPKSAVSLDAVPNASLNGWGDFRHFLGSPKLMKNSLGEQVKVYCLLDRDYRALDDVNIVYEEASTNGIELHIWARKEIENYLLEPSAVSRLITARCGPGLTGPTPDKVKAQIDLISEQLKHHVIHGVADSISASDRRQQPSSCIKKAESMVKGLWESGLGPVVLIPGKRALAMLNDWSHATYGVSFGRVALAEALSASEIDSEMRSVLVAFDQERSLATLR